MVLATHVTGVLLAYAAQILMARWAGPDAFGLFSMAFAGATILALFAGMGIPDAIVRLIPEYVHGEEWARLRSLMDMAERWVGGCAIFLATGITLSVTVFSGGIPAGATPQGALMLGALVVTPALVFHQLYTSICRAQHQLATAYGLSQVGRNLLVIGGIGGIAYLRPSILNGPTLVVIAATSLVLTTILQRHRARHLHPPGRSQPASWSQARQWIRFALPFFFTHGFFSLFQQTDLLLVGVFAPVADVGHYRISIYMAAVVSFVLAAVNTAAAPHFASLHAEGNVEGLRSMTRRLIPWIAGLSVLAFVAIIGAGPFLLPLFGPSFEMAYVPLIILATGHVFSALCGPVDTLLYMTDHEKTAAWIIVTSVVVNLLLSALGLVLFGLVGAAIASAVCMVGWNLAFLRIVRRRVGVDPSILSVW